MVSIIVNNDILLRSFELDDAPLLFDAINTSRQHLHPWLDWVDKTTKPEHSLQFIKDSLHHINMQEALALGIFHNGILIGGIGMHKWEQQLKRAQIGYWIIKEQENKGIMTKCVAQFIGFLFEKIGLNKIEIHFVPNNKRSAKLAERAGFRIEGIIRQSTIRNGMPEDMVVTGLLRSEWQKSS